MFRLHARTSTDWLTWSVTRSIRIMPFRPIINPVHRFWGRIGSISSPRPKSQIWPKPASTSTWLFRPPLWQPPLATTTGNLLWILPPPSPPSATGWHRAAFKFMINFFSASYWIFSNMSSHSFLFSCRTGSSSVSSTVLKVELTLRFYCCLHQIQFQPIKKKN